MEQGYNIGSRRIDDILARVDKTQEEIERGLRARDRRLRLSEPLHERMQETSVDLLDTIYHTANQPPTYQEDYQTEF